MDDYLIRATAGSGMIRAFALQTTRLTDEARRRHDLYPVASAALGRTMTVSLVLGAMIKSGSVTVQVQGDGSLKGVLTSADSEGNVRGYVGNPYVDLPLNAKGKLPVGEAVGEGMLHVIRDMGLKEPYRGSVPLSSGEIGDDFAYYFTASEQTPSIVGVGVLVNPDRSIQVAGGYVIQLLPGASDEIITQLEQRTPLLPPVTTLLCKGKSPEEILHHLLADFNVEIKTKMPVHFACLCTKERLEQSLIAIGEEELQTLITEDEQAELVCHFCEEHYFFSKVELEELLHTLKE